MLLNLPLDPLNDIALYLSISEKLQLALTCKKLKELIFERCFYETLELDREKEDTEYIVLNFRKNRSDGQKVKILKINLNHLSNQLFGEIPIIFPNVVSFDDNTLQKQSRPQETYSEFVKWKDTLVHLENQSSEKAGVVFKLLENDVFSRLKSLVISPLKNDEGSDIDFLKCIKNAPALEHLTLKKYTITLEVMETIHSECPQLIFFKCDSCVILIPEEDSPSTKITPAINVSRFVLLSTAICDQKCILLGYLTQKYTNLIKFEFHPSFSEDKLRLLFPDQTSSEMDSNPDFITRRDELRETRETYSVSASEILSNLPSTLKILQITSLDIYNPMCFFSKECINVTRLEFLGEIDVSITGSTSSTDIMMFKNLPSLKYLSILLDPSIQKYEQAPASVSVIQLKIVMEGTSPQNDMDIGWILLMFPSLNDLAIEYSGTRLIGYESDPPKSYPNLKKISIGPSETHSNLLNFISCVAPNLKDLHWWVFGESIKEEMQSRDMNRPIIINLNAPKIENGQPSYTIDLTGFSLDCFHLEIDLRMEITDVKEDILLKLKNKTDTGANFIISKEFKCIYFKDYGNINLNEEITAIITVRYDYAKMLIINSQISVDLEKGQIQLKYS